MISIEGHRASIGKFYDKCKRLSNVEQNDCYCNVYESYLAEVGECYNLDVLNRFYKYFSDCYDQILVEIESCDRNEYGFYVHMVECYDQILEVIESYDPSFLKVIQLLIDGDVESNPGPTENQNIKSPGRGKKGKVFNFKKQKVDSEIDFNIISSNVRDPNIPLGLLNRGENVCFFNSVVQVLYAIPAFRNFVHELTLDNQAVIAIKEIFEEISTSNERVRTSKYLQNLELTNYIFGEQYDAHECLLQLVNRVYPAITNDCMFKVATLESTQCNCNHHIENPVEGMDLALQVEDTRNIQTVTYLLDKVQTPSIVDGYICDKCDIKNTSNKADLITQTSDILIIHLKIFKYMDIYGTIKKIIPNLNIEEEIYVFKYWTLHAIIYHEGQLANSGHYKCGVKVNERWFMISDSSVVQKQMNLSCKHGDFSVPYILIYKKRTDVVVCIPNSVNDASEILNRQSVLKELDRQNKKIITADEKSSQSVIDKQNDDLGKVKSPVKRKKKYSTIQDCDKKRKKRDQLDDDAKAKIQDKDTKQHQKKRANLDDENKSKIQDKNTNYQQKKRANLDEEIKSKIQDENTKQHQKKRADLDDENKSKIQDKDTKQHQAKRARDKCSREELFNNLQTHSMVDPSILETEAFKLIQEEFKTVIKEGPTYICDICWKFEFKKNVIKLKVSTYDTDIYNDCHTCISDCKSEWICRSCHKSLLRKKMPMQAQANNLQLCPKTEELENLCPLELMLISQIIPFMFIVAKTKGAQHGLKGQCVLVPTDLKKVQTILPRSCDEEYLISLALKRRLTDKSSVNKQHIRPAAVNRALAKLTEINPFYKDVSIDDEWANLSEQSDPELWKLLTDENAENKEHDEETDSDDDIEGNDNRKEKELKMSAVPYPTVLHNIDGPNISASEIVNIAPGEGQIPVSFTSEPDWEALAFPKHYSTGKNHYNEKRKIYITPSKYVHARLKCSDDRFASNPQYIFHALDWIERNAVASSIHFAERKQFQSEINVGQLVNQENVRRMISDDQIYTSFKNIRCTPQYFRNMLLDVLAKIRQFGVYTFFLTCSAAEFHWTEIIQVVARQYGEILTDEQVNDMDWSTKLKYLKRNPVTVARQIDYVFKQLFGKVILSDMNPIGQILNFDDRREFQNRGTEHIHVPIHVVDAPKIDENDKSNDNEVVAFIDKYITCSLPDGKKYHELNTLVKTVQTHHHTTTCRKKKGITCRFNAPWPPSEETLIVRGEEDVDKTKLSDSKKTVDKVLSQIAQIDDLSDITEKELLEMCGVSDTEYYNALEYGQKKVSIIYKRRPCEVNIGPYNTVILMLLKANMNIQFVTGIYAMLIYLTSYLCKPEHAMSELMKKAAKEAYSKDIKGKMHSIGNVFLTKREVSTHEAVKRVLSLPMRHSNIDVLYIPTGLKKNRTRILKPQSILETMHPEDTNVYASSILDKYENRPDELEQMCLADFATNYVNKKAELQVEHEDIKSYTIPVSGIEDSEPSPYIIVLKNEMGEMRKRSRPCVMRFHKVTKMKSPEEYYLRILQLYLPWRNESELMEDTRTYEEKYNEVESSILCNIHKHEPSLETDIDYDELHNFDLSDSDEEEDNDEFSIINPDLIDLEIDDGNGVNNVPVAPTTVDNVLLPNEMFYEMCSQLNECQQHLFNFIMKYAIEYRFAEKNDVPSPEPFHIFLSGGAGVGKTFLVNVLTEYLKRILRYPGQSLEEPSVLVTASTGKAAIEINGITLHSAFHLPIKKDRMAQYHKPSHELLQTMRNKYKYLKVLLSDEISMTGRETFKDLNLALQTIMNNELPFGGVSLLLIGDLLQLPPVKQQGIFMNARTGTYGSFAVSLWQDLFKLHELFEIVRQSSDPEFAQILNRVREGKHTDDDVMQIKALANTDISGWSSEFVKLYLTNYLAGRENEKCIENLTSKVVVIESKDSRRDLETGRCAYSIPDNTSLSDTGNLPAKLKVCVGARVMLTDNISLSDRLINGSMGTVVLMSKTIIMERSPLCGKIYVKFDDPQAGNSSKDRRLIDELKECVPISAITKEFSFTKQRKTTNSVQRKQFPLILAHAITVHKSQGSTLEFMKGDLDRTCAKALQSGKGYKVPISPGQFYTLLSRAKSRDKVQLLNFEPDYIKVNRPALEEMDRMRNESTFSWKHPLMKMTGSKMCLFNIRSWNAHLEHFLSDKMYIQLCNVFCFTETHVNNEQFSHIDKYEEGWKDIHKRTDHGLAICYNESKVKIIQEFQPNTALEILPVLIEIENEHTLLILVYRKPGPVGNFVNDLVDELTCLPRNYRILLVGDFNLDQILHENIEKINPLIEQFNLHQRSHYSTHIHGGILDLVFDNKKSESVEWMPSPYSDHLILLFQL